MGLFEWWMERKNPGPTGNAQFGQDPSATDQWPLWVQVLVVLLGGAAWIGLGFLVWPWALDDALLFLLGFAAYLALAYFVHPAPATRNMGWMGGLIDHPFRFSDDVNRFLLFFQAFLYPGKIMLWTWRILWSWIR